MAALNDALSIFKRADSQAVLIASFRALSLTLADLGDWRVAYERRLDLMTHSDLLLKHPLDQRFATLKVAFDSEAKDKENRLFVREGDTVESALAQA